MEKIKDLSLLLSHHLPPGTRIYNYNIQDLNSEGQHFSSDVKELKVCMKNKDGQEYNLDLVLKMMPAEDIQVKVNSKLGFKKEAAFYQLTIPEYHKMQRSYNLDIQNLCPKFYHTSNELIVLEDLRCLQYSMCKQSLDEKHTRLVIRELAKFHATGVALKLANPGLFQDKLASVVIPALQNSCSDRKEEINSNLRHEITTHLKNMEGFESFIDAVDSLLRDIDNKKLPVPSEPYSTLLHNDLWRGNILFKYCPNNEPVSVKFIDFQTTIYNSPARDLVYFFFTSVEENVLNYFEAMLSFYHFIFIDYLSKLGCNPREFSFEKFLTEVNKYGPTKFKHIILLFRSLYGSSKNYEAVFRKHLQRIVLKFRSRGWL